MAEKQYCDGEMNLSQYLAWIRSALRSKSLRWKPRGNALIKAREQYKGTNSRQKWQYTCAICQHKFQQKQVVVDHYPIAAGSLLSIKDISQFATNLYCNSSNLRVLCKPCHSTHTFAETHDITFEEAKIEKEIISINKMSLKDIKQWLTMHGIKCDKMKKEECKEAVRNYIRGEDIAKLHI